MVYTASTLLFDLDGCLVRSPILHKVPHNIAKYAIQYLGYSAETAVERCKANYLEHGTNLEAFLAEGFDVSPEHYHTHVHHTLPYHELEEDPALRAILEALPADKYVFTNADEHHARKCLAACGLSTVFGDRIIGFETLQRLYTGPGTACKPKEVAMQLALSVAGSEPMHAMFFDDAPRNIHMAMDCGVRGILVGREGVDTCEYTWQIDSLYDLPALFPQFDI